VDDWSSTHASEERLDLARPLCSGPSSNTDAVRSVSPTQTEAVI